MKICSVYKYNIRDQINFIKIIKLAWEKNVQTTII